MTTTFAITSDGKTTWVGDAHHKGADIYWSDRLKKWVVVDLENCDVKFCVRLAAYRSTIDGDQSGLNMSCVACDLDGVSGLWIVDLNTDDDAASDHQDVELVWDSLDA